MSEQRQVHAIEKSLDALVQSACVSLTVRKPVAGQKVRRSGGLPAAVLKMFKLLFSIAPMLLRITQPNPKQPQGVI